MNMSKITTDNMWDYTKSNALYCINILAIIVGIDIKTQLVNPLWGVPEIIWHYVVISNKLTNFVTTSR